MASFPGQKSAGPALPNPVVGLVATPASASEIDLTWTAVPGTILYRIYRDGSFLTTDASSPFADTGLAAASSHTYQVSAVNGNGEGLRSLPATALTFPGPVTGLTATPASTSQINLAWNPTTGASSYRAFRNAGLVGSPSGTSFPDTGLTASTTYSYTVAAANASGVGAQSAPVNATTQAGSARIKWQGGKHFFGSGGTWENGDNLSSKFVPEMTQALKTQVNIGGTLMNPDWVIGYKLFVSWSSLANGPVTFTGNVAGLSSGTLTAAPHNGNQVYFARFVIGGVEFMRNVTVTGTSATWAGSGQWLGPLPAGTVTVSDFFMFSGVDFFSNWLLTQPAVPKYLWLQPTCMSFSTAPLNTNDDSRVPFYITHNAIYGPTPPGTSGMSGWWGANNQGGTYSAAIWRPAVMAEYALCWRMLGIYKDGDPFFYALIDQETSAYAGDASARNTFTYAAWAAGQSLATGTIRQSGSNNYMVITAISSTTTAPTGTGSNIPDGTGAWKWLNVLNQNDGTYSDSGLMSALQTMLTTGRASFQTTNLGSANTFFVAATACQQFTKWMCDNAFVQSTDDSSGQNYYAAGHTSNSWGMAAFFGITISGSTWTPQPDQRGLSAYFADIEQPDISATVPAGNPSIPSTLPQILLALNQTVNAQNSACCIVSKTGNPTWTQMTTILQSTPLTTTTYPQRYPQ